jgi:hypothetical protein
MLKKFALSIVAIMLLTSAGFANVGYIAGHALFEHGHTAIVGHMAYSYYFCSAVGLQQQTYIVGCQYHVINNCHWWPSNPPWNHTCGPLWGHTHSTFLVTGGDATATAVSYNGSADPTAQAYGGDATLEISSIFNPTCVVTGGNATATATSYGGNAGTSAHAVGGDAVVIIK